MIRLELLMRTMLRAVFLSAFCFILTFYPYKMRRISSISGYILSGF